jgi:hypothetical protein
MELIKRMDIKYTLRNIVTAKNYMLFMIFGSMYMIITSHYFAALIFLAAAFNFYLLKEKYKGILD